MAFKAALAALVISSASGAGPAPPVWPPTFNVSFIETTSDLSHTFTGVWAYDWTTKTQRIDRSTGKYDRYCSSVKSDDSPCTHIVTGGMRYLIWPRLSFCCACCTAAAGCGIVTPTWMRDSNGTFVGTSNLTTPAWTGLADQWEITGLQPNVWATEAGTTIPVYFGQVPNDYLFTVPATWAPNATLPAALFALPSYCAGPSGKCPQSICSVAEAARGDAAPAGAPVPPRP